MKIYIFIFILIFSDQAHAAFQEMGWTVRSVGMGHACAAVSEDYNAVGCNPGAIPFLETKEFSVMYGRPFLGLNLKSGIQDNTHLQLSHLSAVSPFKNWGYFSAAGSNFLLANLYQEDTFLIGYARPIPLDYLWGPNVKLGLGLNIKLLRRSYSVDAETLDRERNLKGEIADTSPFFNPDSINAWSGDLGLNIRLKDQLSFGFSSLNFNQPNVGFKEIETVPLQLRWGSAYLFSDWNYFEDPLAAIDLDYRKFEQQSAQWVPHVGIQTWLALRTYGLRMGFSSREISAGFSYIKTFSRFIFQVDYSYSTSFELGTSSIGSHRMALVWKKFVHPK